MSSDLLCVWRFDLHRPRNLPPALRTGRPAGGPAAGRE